MNPTAERRAALPLTPTQQLVHGRLRHGPWTTDEVADRCSLTRDGARAALMALKAKGKVRHTPGRPARWERI